MACVDVKNGKIVRIRPLHYDWKYTKDEVGTWKVEARGKSIEPLMKTLPSYFAYGYRSVLTLPIGLNIRSRELTGNQVATLKNEYPESWY
jgi:hypothetical protein